MHLNSDFTKRAVVVFAENDWIASPMPGVDRKMLDRIGGEVARATTIVRYAAGSAFAAHVHDGGEEIFVLDGVFRDENGDYPEGTYLRNPPGSRHAPSAPEGAIILVKLHQFDPADRRHVCIDASGAPSRDLYSDPREEVRIESWAPGAQMPLSAPGGMELLVLWGGFAEGGDRLGRWDWLRLPPGTETVAAAGPGGARLWVKSGHLAQVSAPVS